jgi:hypothetical protein
MKDNKVNDLELNFEDFSKIQELEARTRVYLPANIARSLQLLYRIYKETKIVSANVLAKYFNVSNEEVMGILHDLLDPAEVLKNYNDACEGRSELLSAHPWIQKKVLSRDFSSEEIERYFLSFEILKRVVKELRPVAFKSFL